jgi:hypothetical protein
MRATSTWSNAFVAPWVAYLSWLCAVWCGNCTELGPRQSQPEFQWGDCHTSRNVCTHNTRHRMCHVGCLHCRPPESQTHDLVSCQLVSPPGTHDAMPPCKRVLRAPTPAPACIPTVCLSFWNCLRFAGCRCHRPLGCSGAEVPRGLLVPPPPPLDPSQHSPEAMQAALASHPTPCALSNLGSLSLAFGATLSLGRAK